MKKQNNTFRIEVDQTTIMVLRALINQVEKAQKSQRTVSHSRKQSTSSETCQLTLDLSDPDVQKEEDNP